MRRTSIAAAALLFSSTSIAGLAADPARYISVVGTAQVHVVPDLVVLSIAVETFSPKIDEALTKNDDRTTRVLDLAKQFALDPKDIQTEDLSLSPKYARREGDRYDYDYEKVLGYNVSRAITVNLRDLSKCQKLVRQLIEAGTNRIDSISFTVSQPRKYRDQARQLALRAAQEKATSMAETLSQKIGRPIRIVESGSRMPISYTASNTNIQAQAESSAGDPPDLENGPVAPGTITITAVVSVEFELE